MSTEKPNKLAGRIDGALELLDRQLLDRDGLMLGKVDDVELTQSDQRLVVSAVLTGPVALLHRLGARLGNELTASYVRLRPSETSRSVPWRIPISDVARLDSAVHLRVRRDESLQRGVERLRLGTLTGMTVLEPDGTEVGQVLDARFAPDAEGRLALESLLVGRGRPGSLLGYDRREGMGPWVVRAAVRWLHRHTRAVAREHARILWEERQVRLDAPIDRVGTRLPSA